MARFLTTLMAVWLFFAPQPAQACVFCACVPAANNMPKTTDLVHTEHADLRELITREFRDHRLWLLDVVFLEYLLPAMMRMTEQLTAVAMHQVLAVGMFLDAKQQLEAERLFQQKVAEAHKDYQSSFDMCVIGTNMGSLAHTERRAELTAHVLSQRSQDRQMGAANSNASEGVKEDIEGRYEQFLTRYCHSKDNDENFIEICPVSAPEKTRNKDVSYGQTVDSVWTLDIDFSDNVLTDDEQDIFALASNLYASRVPTRFPEVALQDPDKQQFLLDMRSVIAKRSVAEHAFNSIVGMKAIGHLDSKDVVGEYMVRALEQFDIARPEAIEILGHDAGGNVRPSYYAQMEVLTRKIYQEPDFYTNLYDTPTNIDRKYAAMQAIGLMQDFDTLQSYLRTESMLSVLVEVELSKLQEKVQNTIGESNNAGKRE
ncbi:MAG: hypothetical protein H6868_04205 [Rhodospirillales bacterium]|nr:hypothetical protein [Rhodospirillales bacterium]